MNNGLELELLMQLFFALEGLSLWKVAAPVARSVTDFSTDDEICEKILAGGGTASERGKRCNQFLKASCSYRKWRRAASLVCSFAPLTFFAVIVMLLSIIYGMKNGWCLLCLNAAAPLYFVAKSIIVWVTAYYARRYDAALIDLTPVQDSIKPDRLQSV